MKSCPIGTKNIIRINAIKKQEHPRGIVDPLDGLNSIKRPQLSLHMCTTIPIAKENQLC